MCIECELLYPNTDSDVLSALGLAGAKKYIADHGVKGGNFVAITSVSDVPFFQQHPLSLVWRTGGKCKVR